MASLNRTLLATLSILMLSSAITLMAQEPGKTMPEAKAAAADPAKPILQMVQRFENNFMALAQAMPADKYNYAPSASDFKSGSPAKFDTVRTFAQQLTHVTEEGYRNLEPFGAKLDPSVDLKAIDAMTSKDDILKALKASFDYQEKVVASITPENAFTPVGPRNTNVIAALIAVMNDDGDHYGQMVEYGRINGIIPPSTERMQQMQKAPAAQSR